MHYHEKRLLEDFRLTHRGVNFFAIPVEPSYKTTRGENGNFALSANIPKNGV